MFLKPSGWQIKFFVALPEILVLWLVQIFRMTTRSQKLSQNRRDDIFVNHTELITNKNVASVASRWVWRRDNFDTRSVLERYVCIRRRGNRAVFDLSTEFRWVWHQFVSNVFQNVDRLTSVASRDADLCTRVEYTPYHAINRCQKSLANQYVTLTAFYPSDLCVSTELSIYLHPNKSGAGHSWEDYSLKRGSLPMRYGGMRRYPNTYLGVGVHRLKMSNQWVASTDFARLLPAYYYAARPFLQRVKFL